ncbi:hypothetical protein G6F37_006125 [Rhizopus arrhizus]|nr:hypothetical protein G6F38_004754 [Rhizopus arrhizus]KAG1158080.1 hypothetical protein G6F37_006125 [Rhizopus arrhizus]
MTNSHINAVIGDVTSDLTKASASVTSLAKIPQCSAAPGLFGSSDKSSTYLFHTSSTSIPPMSVIASWISHMGWQQYAIIFTDNVVEQDAYTNLIEQSEKYGLNLVNLISIDSVDDDTIEDALDDMNLTGARIVILIATKLYQQKNILSKAKEMGYMSKGWVWLLPNDLSRSDISFSSYDGLMYISNLWNLTDNPAYAELYQTWQSQPVPANFSDPTNWNKTGLSFGATQTYSCLELLALGINRQALNEYNGGRSKGLQDLANHTFNSSNMIPTFYNLNYNGPAGFMNFSSSGDPEEGNFQASYFLNGVSVPYAHLNASFFELLSNVDVVYLGNTTEKPKDLVGIVYLNPTFHDSAGIIVGTLSICGIFFCILMAILISLFRDLKPIMISSPVFCYLQLLGLVMCYLTVLLNLVSITPANCIARQFLLSMGFVFVIGSIIAKNFRIYKIYQNVFTTRTSRLKAPYLLRMVGIFQLFVIVPLVAWNAVYQISLNNYRIGRNTYCIYCQYATSLNSERFNLAQFFVLLWVFILIIVAAFLAFKTRNVSSKWSESKQITYVSYNLGVSAAILIPAILFNSKDYVTTIYLQFAAILFGASFTLITLFVPKFTVISKHIHKKWQKLLNSEQVNSNTDPNIQLNMVTERTQDFTYEAHEGVLPVKKVTRFDLLSIWTLKRIVLVPFQKCFIISDKSGEDANLYNYDYCEVMTKSCKENHHIFRVRTENGAYFLFQVYDQDSLERWVHWFNMPDEQMPSKVSKDEATFGQVLSDQLSQPTLSYQHSSQHYLSNFTQPTTPHVNSFGVVAYDTNWQRYD